MKPLIEFSELLRFIAHLRCMLIGMAVGAALGISYKRLLYSPSNSDAGLVSNAGDDAFVIITAICAFVGVVLDIRRSLNNRD